MKVLITFAFDREFSPWRRMRRFRRRVCGGETAYVTQIGGAEVGVILTGIGPDRARVSASRAMKGAFSAPDVCISSGFTGALRSEHLLGTVLAARTISSQQRQSDLEDRPFESHPWLLAQAQEIGAIPVERFCTARHTVGTATAKRLLGETADAVDMESFEIVREAEKKGVACIAIRAVSDAADEDLPLDVSRIFADGQLSISRVLGQLARRPQALPDFIRLGRQSSRAAKSLAIFLERYIPAVVRHARPLRGSFSADAVEQQVS